MILKTNVYSEIKINILKDLHKLKPIMEGNNLKVNKSQIGLAIINCTINIRS